MKPTKQIVYLPVNVEDDATFLITKEISNYLQANSSIDFYKDGKCIAHEDAKCTKHKDVWKCIYPSIGCNDNNQINNNQINTFGLHTKFTKIRCKFSDG